MWTATIICLAICLFCYLYCDPTQKKSLFHGILALAFLLSGVLGFWLCVVKIIMDINT